MKEAQCNVQVQFENDLFKGGLWIFLFYSGLMFLLGMRNWLYIFLTALLLKNLSAHLCRNEINQAIGSALSVLSLFFLFPFSGVLETRLAAFPVFQKTIVAFKLNSLNPGPEQCTMVRGVLVLVFTVVSCSFCIKSFLIG